MLMKRIHLLAAELFSYSYDNYVGHLGVNLRFDRYMPEDAALLEQAEKEGWSDEQIAAESDFKPEHIPDWKYSKVLRSRADKISEIEFM